ncbi:MAG TPA: lysyl oxidase family protein [Kofleriaceae bacterium]|nr:lysyl oxidase family protein [Kofleriaceae bacterium]
MSRDAVHRAAAAAAAALAVTACRGPDEVIPPVFLDAPALDAAELDAPADSRVDAPSDGRPALPDMQLVESLMTGTIQVQDLNFNTNSCEQLEGCIGGSGARRILRFSTVTANMGTGDLYFGPPQDNPAFQYSECHGHYHFSGYADYELVDNNNVVVEGHKQAFCLLDTLRVVPGAPGPYYTCENQGIGAGWADSYASFLPCQWIDITNVTPGAYTLRVRINPDLAFEESDYSNNTLDIPVAF